MKLLTLRRNRPDTLPGVVGAVRVGSRTKDVIRRIRPGDVAVIDQPDLDRHSAEALVNGGAAVVVNAGQSCTGRYPNLGPGVIAAAGIPLVDHVGDEVFSALKDGEQIRVDDGTLYREAMPVGTGEVLDERRVGELMEQAKEGLTTQLEAFTANTTEYLRRERELLLENVGVPDVATRFEGRHVLVVVRAHDYRRDLMRLKSYIREYHPVLIGVEDGADALREAGYTPDLVLGDMDAVSDAALKSGAELVLHTHRDGRAQGANRLERLGLNAVPFPATGTNEDLAMLLADARGADLIVAVGTHANLNELLDKNKADMSSAFVTRLRLGPRLIDAKGVARLHHTRIRMWQLLVLLFAALLAVGVSIVATPAGSEWAEALGDRWTDLTDWIQGLIS